MLYSFTVGNFLSFRENQTLEMLPEALKEKKDYLHVPYLFDIDARLLKSIALYGHNSFGKTNFIKAYDFFIHCIFNSFTFGKTEGFFEVDFFKLNIESANQPTNFEIKFFLRDIKYRYSFQVLRGKVIREDLWYAKTKVRENYLFQRVDGADIIISKAWSKDAGKKLEQSLFFTKSHNLFLSVLLSQENIPLIDDIGNWLKGNIIVSNISEEKHLKKVILILAQSQYRSIIQKFIEIADLGFITIIEKIDNHYRNKPNLDKDFVNLLFAHELKSFELYTEHKVYDKDYKFVELILFDLLKCESAGSIKYLILACYLTFAIIHGQLIWIDEIDSQLHVNLLDHLIRTFNNAKINSKGSQMVFTSHNTKLLSDKALRRDQILLVNKSIYGESSILKFHTTKKPIRQDVQMDKKYLAGDVGISSKLKRANELPDLGFNLD